MTGSLKIGVVLSGGQAPGGHNVISGFFDYLQDRAEGSTMYDFKGGPAGVMKGKYVELTPEFIYPYRNQGGFDMICSGSDKIETPEQFKQAEETAENLDLDGLVVIGGDDSNTNACLLAENFRQKNMKTRVIGCPKTIDGDLKCKEVPTSFGFDTACKWDILSKDASIRGVARIANGQAEGNYVSILSINNKTDILVMQESSFSETGSYMVYSSINAISLEKN